LIGATNHVLASPDCKLQAEGITSCLLPDTIPSFVSGGSFGYSLDHRRIGSRTRQVGPGDRSSSGAAQTCWKTTAIDCGRWR